MTSETAAAPPPAAQAGASATEGPFPGTRAAWRLWRTTQLLPTSFVMAALALWCFWMLAVFAHPLTKTNAGALAESARQGNIQGWTLVEPTRSGNFVPALVDPVTARWETASTDLQAVQSSGDQPTVQSSSGMPYLAWRDSEGTHLAQLGGGLPSFTIRSAPGTSGGGGNWNMTSDEGHIAVTLPEERHVTDVRHLWNADRLLGPAWLVPSLTLALAVALLWREPRYRTRWSWFWLLTAPLGIGFVWMLLREQLFPSSPPPERRPGGWTGFVVALGISVPVSLLLTGIAPTS